MTPRMFLVFFFILFALSIASPSLALSARDKLEAKITGVIKTERKPLYTAYNLFTDGHKVRAINFRVGTIIPVGTPVEVEIYEEESDFGGSGYDDDRVEGIRFKTLTDNHLYNIEFTSRYHPGTNVYAYADKMFTDKNFDQLTTGKSPEIIDAIRRSAVIPGMSKEDVILSYGYPAEHRTPSLQGNIWTYWKNRHRSKKICFDIEEKAISCAQQKSNDL
ncbi:hypothetical protein C2E25_06130 [Geothermobacter hydrogeniphilus]|uniref:Uncharacterized protein n=1 Tax=Geothermobacter hydrogeniphilus TaxID=1969733 RepID=A0A2K2HBL3_9BACT|nr:hypothetical protein [Geothermobacter hydrogeniphilus]PNU20619.1 hypothetical protein C2E25_06130 [Geothermobacter hydrogeniphilus]